VVRPSAQAERQLAREGFRFIAGVDEAGRGSWAGPLVAAAVILLESFGRKPVWCRPVCDSKLIPHEQREIVGATIRNRCVSYGVWVVEPEIIDLIGLSAAGHLAMRRALRGLNHAPEFVLVDAFTIPGIDVPQRGIIRGDQLSVSIAAASIVAKTHRDSLLETLDLRYPAYGLARHKGYGTGLHRAGLQAVGASRIHRHSYRPVIPFVSS
jgi:ribonuclease HII